MAPLTLLLASLAAIVPCQAAINLKGLTIETSSTPSSIAELQGRPADSRLGAQTFLVAVPDARTLNARAIESEFNADKVDYIPDHAFMVTCGWADALRLRDDARVAWMDVYRPEWKLAVFSQSVGHFKARDTFRLLVSLVPVRRDADPATRQALVHDLQARMSGASFAQVQELTPAVLVVETNAASVATVLNVLSETPEVQYVERDMPVHIMRPATAREASMPGPSVGGGPQLMLW